MKQEVEKWRPFGHPDGDIRDLSFLDAHQAVYVQHHEGKEPLEYRWICPYISRHLLSLNPLQARCRRYSRGER
ncbi:heat shock protein C [Escherichia coli]|nr:heat shock protein C [Escherichia coli]